MDKKKPGAYAGYTAARKAANARYEAETVERVSLVLRRGEKARIKAAADRMGMSLNGYIVQAIEAQMRKEGQS